MYHQRTKVNSNIIDRPCSRSRHKQRRQPNMSRRDRSGDARGSHQVLEGFQLLLAGAIHTPH